MNYWIFQSKKERYDLSDDAVLFDGMTGWWTANQYRSDMQIGDKVFFWMAGDASIRGIYGWGELTSLPERWEKNGKKGYSVDIKCEKRLSSYLTIDEIKKIGALEKMQILHMPIGSNFLLSTKEGEELERIAASRT